MQLTVMQQQAIDQALAAINKNEVFRIGGYAGTGKSTIARFITEGSNKKFAVGAFMGKAANVLRKKGITHAETIHRLIYHWDDKAETFVLKNKPPAEGFYLDEGSMVPQDLWDDIRSFNQPSIVTGDPGQLEPIGKDAHLMHDPQIVLDVDHRFGSEGARFANHVRLTGEIPKANNESIGVYDKSLFMKHLTNSLPDIVLCGFNRTRVACNKTIRKLKNFYGQIMEGEQLICLRNDREMGVFNGMMMTVKKIHSEGEHHKYGRYTYCDVDKDDGSSATYVKVWHGHFNREDQLDWRTLPQRMIVADYGYCCTVHKFQGSETERVYVVDEQCDKWCPTRHRYTAFTRFQERLQVYV